MHDTSQANSFLILFKNRNSNVKKSKMYDIFKKKKLAELYSFIRVACYG